MIRSAVKVQLEDAGFDDVVELKACTMNNWPRSMHHKTLGLCNNQNVMDCNHRIRCTGVRRLFYQLQEDADGNCYCRLAIYGRKPGR